MKTGFLRGWLTQVLKQHFRGSARDGQKEGYVLSALLAKLKRGFTPAMVIPITGLIAVMGVTLYNLRWPVIDWDGVRVEAPFENASKQVAVDRVYFKTPMKSDVRAGLSGSVSLGPGTQVRIENGPIAIEYEGIVPSTVRTGIVRRGAILGQWDPAFHDAGLSVRVWRGGKCLLPKRL